MATRSSSTSVAEADGSRRIGSRVRIERSSGHPVIRIRAPRNWGMLIFLPVWITGWTFGGIAALAALLREPQAFVALWLSFWAAAEAFTVFAWSWMAFGEEIVSIHERSLNVAWRIGAFQKMWRYPLLSTAQLRARGWFGPPTSFADTLRPWGLTGGTVAFDHGGETVRFGIGLPEQEAQEVADELGPHLPGQEGLS